MDKVIQQEARLLQFSCSHLGLEDTKTTSTVSYNARVNTDEKINVSSESLGT